MRPDQQSLVGCFYSVDLSGRLSEKMSFRNITAQRAAAAQPPSRITLRRANNISTGENPISKWEPVALLRVPFAYIAIAQPLKLQIGFSSPLATCPFFFFQIDLLMSTVALQFYPFSNNRCNISQKQIFKSTSLEWCSAGNKPLHTWMNLNQFLFIDFWS